MTRLIETFEGLTPKELHSFDKAKRRGLDGTTPEEVLVMGEVEIACMDGFLGGKATELARDLVEIHENITTLSGHQPLPIDFIRRRYLRGDSI